MSPPADGALVGAIISKSSTIGCRVAQNGIVICDATWSTDVPTRVKRTLAKADVKGARECPTLYTQSWATPH